MSQGPESQSGEVPWYQEYTNQTLDNKLEAASPSETLRKIKAISKTLETGMLVYMRRPDSDSRVLDLVQGVADNLIGSLWQGASDEPLLPRKSFDIKAALYGTEKLLDPGEDRVIPDVEPMDNAALGHRFIELTEILVGRIDPATRDALLRFRSGEGQNGDTITYHK